jgi:hypothetical protein
MNKSRKKLGRNPFEQKGQVKSKRETGPASVNIIPELLESRPEISVQPVTEKPDSPETREQLNTAGLFCYWADFWAIGIAEQWLFWMKMFGAKRQ